MLINFGQEAAEKKRLGDEETQNRWSGVISAKTFVSLGPYDVGRVDKLARLLKPHTTLKKLGEYDVDNCFHLRNHHQ